MKRCISLALLSALVAIPSALWASPALSAQQAKAVDERIAQYIEQNPEAIIGALKSYQRKMAQDRQKKTQESLTQNRQALSNTKGSPTLGNPKGSITLTEFMDYRCGHCKTMGPVIEQAIGEIKDLRVVVKELPIFGASSSFAAKVALAADRQGKFAQVHKQLLKTPSKQLGSEEGVMNAIKSIKLDKAQLQKDLKDPALDKQLQANQALARKLYINATPMFVLSQGDHQKLIPGAVSIDQIKHAIAHLGKDDGMQAKPPRGPHMKGRPRPPHGAHRH